MTEHENSEKYSAWESWINSEDNDIFEPLSVANNNSSNQKLPLAESYYEQMFADSDDIKAIPFWLMSADTAMEKGESIVFEQDRLPLYPALQQIESITVEFKGVFIDLSTRKKMARVVATIKLKESVAESNGGPRKRPKTPFTILKTLGEGEAFFLDKAFCGLQNSEEAENIPLFAVKLIMIKYPHSTFQQQKIVIGSPENVSNS